MQILILATNQGSILCITLFLSIRHQQGNNQKKPNQNLPKICNKTDKKAQPIKKKKSKHNHILETLGSQSFCLNSVCLGNYIACYLPIMFSF